MQISKEWIYKDHHPAPGEELGSTEELRISTRQGHVIGYILMPCRKPGQLHPAILMLHGFPGICNNHDIAQLLRSAGFVVFVPNAPGAWGSEGYYSFEGIVEAALDVASYMVDPAVCQQFHIDPKTVFLFGHSMGGFAAVNVAKQFSQFRGCIYAAPCDLDWHFRNPGMDFIERLPERAAGYLRTQIDLSEDAANIHEEFSFRTAYPMLKNKDFLLIQCEKDQAIPAQMLCEFAEKVQDKYFGSGLQRYVLLPTDHAFNDSKFTVAEAVIDFCRELINDGCNA